MLSICKNLTASIVILHAVEPFATWNDESGIGIEERVKKPKTRTGMNIEEIKKRVHAVCRRQRLNGSACLNLVSSPRSLGAIRGRDLKAGRESCDAIVLGTHGKGFLRQTFLKCRWFSTGTEPKAVCLLFPCLLRQPRLIG